MKDFIFDLQRFVNISNRNNETVLSGGDDDDNITNWGADVRIDCGGGEDIVTNYKDGSGVTINGGADNDVINNMSAPNVIIYGGAGDDNIQNTGSYGIVNGDAGNDYIENKGNNFTFKYKNGDGNDSIKGFSENSTLSIDGSEYSTQASGDDVIVTLAALNLWMELVWTARQLRCQRSR